MNHVVSEDQEHRQSVFQNTSEFYVQKQHKSGDKLCLSVCQVLKIVTDRNTHILTLQQAHINTTSDNQSTKQISWLQWAKKQKHSNVVREKVRFHWSLELWCARFEAIISFQTQKKRLKRVCYTILTTKHIQQCISTHSNPLGRKVEREGLPLIVLGSSLS